MIYFLHGANFYQVLRKLREFKAAFSKKADNFLIEELGEENEISSEQFHSALGQSNLFSKTRLVIFRNILESSPKIFEILKENGDFLKDSKDIFVFWEKDLTKHKEISAFFKKYSEKIQEVKPLEENALDLWLQKKAQSSGIKLSKEDRELMIEEAGAGAEWALENELEKMVLGGGTSKKTNTTQSANPFIYIERIFGSRALVALKEMALAGIDPQRFIYTLLWKLKQKKMIDAYFRGIQTESYMRRDPKNAEEILERFIFSMKNG